MLLDTHGNGNIEKKLKTLENPQNANRNPKQWLFSVITAM
jgi:hypothetical protein